MQACTAAHCGAVESHAAAVGVGAAGQRARAAQQQSKSAQDESVEIHAAVVQVCTAEQYAAVGSRTAAVQVCTQNKYGSDKRAQEFGSCNNRPRQHSRQLRDSRSTRVVQQWVQSKYAHIDSYEVVQRTLQQ